MNRFRITCLCIGCFSTGMALGVAALKPGINELNGNQARLEQEFADLRKAHIRLREACHTLEATDAELKQSEQRLQQNSTRLRLACAEALRLRHLPPPGPPEVQ